MWTALLGRLCLQRTSTWMTLEASMDIGKWLVWTNMHLWVPLSLLMTGGKKVQLQYIYPMRNQNMLRRLRLRYSMYLGSTIARFWRSSKVPFRAIPQHRNATLFHLNSFGRLRRGVHACILTYTTQTLCLKRTRKYEDCHGTLTMTLTSSWPLLLSYCGLTPHIWLALERLL